MANQTFINFFVNVFHADVKNVTSYLNMLDTMFKGTGLTLSNLCYGILFESFKSEVINMQSIGRGLGLSDMRDTFILYDIIDVFDKNTLSNKLFLQGLAKIKIYQENQYKFRIENVTLD